MESVERPRDLRTPPLLVALSILTAAMFAGSVYLVFFYAPIEKVMGFVQKIFYFHVPSAMMMFLAVAVSAVGSIGYLINRQDRWDRLGNAGVELAITFGFIVLITGPLWGRKAWGAFWVWDVRLTSSLVLVLTLVACKIVRSYAGPSAQKLGSGLAVFAVLNSIFVYYSVDIWRGTHPPKLTGTLPVAMKETYNLCLLTFLLAFVCLLWLRLRLGTLKSGLDRLHILASEAESA